MARSRPLGRASWRLVFSLSALRVGLTVPEEALRWSPAPSGESTWTYEGVMSHRTGRGPF